MEQAHQDNIQKISNDLLESRERNNALEKDNMELRDALEKLHNEYEKYRVTADAEKKAVSHLNIFFYLSKYYIYMFSIDSLFYVYRPTSVFNSWMIQNKLETKLSNNWQR